MTDRTILIVEDHTMIAEYIASTVAAAGFEPIQAASLNEARALLSGRRFDLWLCDLNLPDGEGAALLAERASERHRETPAIALTAELTADDRDALLAAGFADALAKPCPPEALRAAIDRAIQPSAGSASVVGSEEVFCDDLGDRSVAVLDDESALNVCGGDRASLAAMRRLMAIDLPLQRERIRQACLARNTDALLGELHKLAAASAWCGAAELAVCGGALRQAATAGDIGAIDAAATRIDAAFGRLVVALIQPG